MGEHAEHTLEECIAHWESKLEEETAEDVGKQSSMNENGEELSHD